MRVNKVFSRRRTVCWNYTQAAQETVTCGSGWIGLCHGQVGGGGGGGKHYTKNRAVLCTWHFHLTFRAAPGPLGGCIRQNLVPRPKAPQGSWVASRGCCGALAARQPLHPCLGGGLTPTPAASWSTLQTRMGGSAAVAPKRGPRLLRLPPRALSRNRPERAAPAGAPNEAGAEPATASAAGHAINWD